MTNNRKEASFAWNPEEGLVCTLFEGDYHFGLAALMNSLVRNGFQGCVAAGYRGELPPWIGQLKAAGNGCYEIRPGARIEFIPLDTPVHFTNFKPQFMRQLLGERPGCKYIWYFDPDIVIRCAWSFYVEWVRHGVALCEDVNGSCPENHPLRHRWSELVSPAGLKNPRPLSRYYNGGFIGLPVTCSSFLDLWQEVTGIAESHGFDSGAFGTGDRTNPFFRADQDTLNITAMYSEHPLSPTGPEVMGFRPGRPVTYHAVGPKPWRGSMLMRALAGESPSGASKYFFTQVSSPIRPYSPLQLRAKRLECAAAAFLGRFYRRM